MSELSCSTKNLDDHSLGVNVQSQPTKAGSPDILILNFDKKTKKVITGDLGDEIP